MNLFLLTAAHDQPTGFQFSIRYVRRALGMLPSFIKSAWIVADDGRVPVYDAGYFIKNEQTNNVCWMDSAGSIEAQFMHMREPTRESGVQSFQSNMGTLARAVLELARPEDVAVVVEDDWFRHDWLADGCKAMTSMPWLNLFGETKTRYYRVDNRRWHVFNPNGRAALSGTMFRAQWGAQRIAEWSRRQDATIMLDDVLWRRSGLDDKQKLLLAESAYVVGIKGLPGARGLGVGAGLSDSHKHDPEAVKLHEWIGDDSRAYLKYLKE